MLSTRRESSFGSDIYYTSYIIQAPGRAGKRTAACCLNVFRKCSVIFAHQRVAFAHAKQLTVYLGEG